MQSSPRTELHAQQADVIRELRLMGELADFVQQPPEVFGGGHGGPLAHGLQEPLLAVELVVVGRLKRREIL